MQFLPIEVSIFLSGLILSWLTAFIADYIIVKIVLRKMELPWDKMNKDERGLILSGTGLACYPGCIVSVLFLGLFGEILLPMITIPSIIVWILGMMIAPALGFKLAIL